MWWQLHNDGLARSFERPQSGSGQRGGDGKNGGGNGRPIHSFDQNDRGDVAYSVEATYRLSMRGLLKTFVLAGLIIEATILVQPALASDLEGPARFCGYSPIIDLLPGEKVTTLEGGIHEGRFRWDGSFGSLDVVGIGWASKPKGRIMRPLSDLPAIFAPRRVHGRDEVAIWNGISGAAYFSAQRRITPAQLDAISRVKLYNEGEKPEECRLRTVFVWQ